MAQQRNLGSSKILVGTIKKFRYKKNVVWYIKEVLVGAKYCLEQQRFLGSSQILFTTTKKIWFKQNIVQYIKDISSQAKNSLVPQIPIGSSKILFTTPNLKCFRFKQISFDINKVFDSYIALCYTSDFWVLYSGWLSKYSLSFVGKSVITPSAPSLKALVYSSSSFKTHKYVCKINNIAWLKL